MSSPRLPIEVLERVIDICSEEAETYNTRYSYLRSFALTCRSWLPRSRFHLFSVLYIQDESRLLSFMILRRQAPTISSYVRDLNIYGPPNDAPTPNDPKKTKAKPWVHLVPLKLGPVLRDLETITLDSVDIMAVHSTFYQALSLFRSTKQLILSGVNFPTFDQFARLVLVFPNLSSLRVGVPDPLIWKDREFDAKLVGAGRSHRLRLSLLSCVSVSSSVLEDMVSWLKITPCMQTLGSISLSGRWALSSEGADAFQSLLENCGGSVLRFEFTLFESTIKNTSLVLHTHYSSLESTHDSYLLF